MTDKLPDYVIGGTRWGLIPGYMIDGVRRYVERGISPGDFLNAVMENDLVHSFAWADYMNEAKMKDWAEFLYTSLPPQCWGSREKVRAWSEAGGLEGMREREEAASAEQG